MLFWVLTAVSVLALASLLAVSFRPFFPHISVRARRAFSLLLAGVLLASSLWMGVSLSHQEEENFRLRVTEMFAARIIYSFSDLERAAAFLPDEVEGEVAVASVQDTAQMMSYYLETAENIELYFFSRDSGRNSESVSLSNLFQNAYMALTFLTDGVADKLTFTPTAEEWEVILAIRGSCQQLKGNMREQLYNENNTLSGMELALAEYRTYEELLQSDPELRKLYQKIADYVYERRQNQ